MIVDRYDGKIIEVANVTQSLALIDDQSIRRDSKPIHALRIVGLPMRCLLAGSIVAFHSNSKGSRRVLSAVR